MFKSFRFAVLIAGVTLGFTAMAQPAPDDQQPNGQDQDQADPPTRVARLSFIKGAVSFVPAGENDWVEAQMNRPLITGDKLWTDTNSRAELEIGSAAIRMDQQSSFDFLNLDDNAAQVELTQGTLNLRVRRLYDGQTYEIDTPTLAFVVNRVGEFRVDVQPDGQTTIVSVTHGGGDVYGEGGSRFHIDEGQSVSFSDPQLQNYQSADLPQPDEFDQFALQRDGRWDAAPSKRYVSEETIGYQDLDDYGSWTPDVPEYGNVWYPTHVEADWSPYHSGHWAWVGSYGWSWVDESPWGFAPFHYGRWAYVGNRWGWCPGEIAVRPVYAPALVAFVGGGVSIGISSGPIGWFPLGYHDVYFPAYRVSRGYFTNVNVYNSRGINVTVVNNYYGGYRSGHVDYANIHYANREVRGAVVAVPAAAFIGARSVRASAVQVNERTFANSRVSGFAAVAPTRASLAGANAARAVPAAAIRNRQIVAATKPPAPVASFATRQAVLAKNPGQPLGVREMRAPVAGAGAAAAANGGRGNNVRVVTQGGAPVRTAAPAIQARTVVGNPAAKGVRGNAALPAVQRGNVNGRPPANTTTNVAPGRAGVAGAQNGGPQGQRLDSSRFAHPNANAPGNAAPGNQAQGRPNAGTAMPNTTRATPNTNGQNARPGFNGNAGQTNRATPNTATQTARPTGRPIQSARPTAESVQSTRTAPNSTRPTGESVQNTRVPPNRTLQNTRPTESTPAQNNRAPVSTQQTVRPTANTPNPRIQSNGNQAQEIHRPANETRSTSQPAYRQPTPAPQQTQMRAPTPAPVQQRAVVPQPVAQPRNNPPPPPQNRGNTNNNSKDKDDDKKRGH
ncbi:MAG: DUF6600 domain-containing protein [Rudaea sp.]